MFEERPVEIWLKKKKKKIGHAIWVLMDLKCLPPSESDPNDQPIDSLSLRV